MRKHELGRGQPRWGAGLGWEPTLGRRGLVSRPPSSPALLEPRPSPSPDRVRVPREADGQRLAGWAGRGPEGWLLYVAALGQAPRSRPPSPGRQGLRRSPTASPSGFTAARTVLY